MLRPPRFWSEDSGSLANTLFSNLLLPFSPIPSLLTARRVRRIGWTAPVPVICCGNLTLGGTGKTILVLDLVRLLASRGVAAHVLTRGYGGSARGPLRVTSHHASSLVGDEPVVLARAAPVWVGADRARSARAALAAGAPALIMDDGLQNPTLTKSFSWIVVDGAVGFGNGRVFPAGPLREPIDAGVRRAQALVVIGDDRKDVRRMISGRLPVLNARLVPDPASERLIGSRVIAFAGIGRPEKFFTSLEGVGAIVLSRHAFPDHHRYREGELTNLRRVARSRHAILVTTTKDYVRLPETIRDEVTIFSVHLRWEDPERLDGLLAPLFRVFSTPLR